MSNEIEVWYSEYDLRQFIDMAVRYKIEGVFKSRTKSEPFSVFSFYVENARKNFDLFANQLNTKLTQNENWKAIKIDVKYRFLPMLNQYLSWYEENKTELEKFQPLCPYSIMLSVVESTKALILEYFPENDTIQKSNSENQMGRTQKSKLDFTKDKLKPTVLELANLDGYEKPSTYLNDLLKEVKQFNDIDFEADFFLKIHYLCQEFADKFWSEGHRTDITEWLNKAPVITEVFKTTWNKLPTQQTETEAEQVTIEMKPVLNPEAVQIVFEIIKDYFRTEQQAELKQILETGNNASQHLIFLDNGNRLADAFKQLKKADVITGCEQKELENWISRNFKYRYRQKVKEYTTRYLNDIISTNKDKCQRPLLNVRIEKTNGETKITKA